MFDLSMNDRRLKLVFGLTFGVPTSTCIGAREEERGRDLSPGSDRPVAMQFGWGRPRRVKGLGTGIDPSRDQAVPVCVEIDSHFVNRLTVSGRGDGGFDAGMKVDSVGVILWERERVKHDRASRP
jgi:hypothetical protein